MIVQDLYAGTLRLSELLRQSEENSKILEDRIRSLEEDLKLAQNSVEISFENARYLEKQILFLEAIRSESNIKIQGLTSQNEEANQFVQRWEQRAVQAENMFSILKQQVDSAQTRRVLSALKSSQKRNRISCLQINFVKWKKNHRVFVRKKYIVSSLELLKHQKMSLAFDCWRNVLAWSKSSSYRISQLELRNGAVNLIQEVADLNQTSLLLMQSLENQYREALNLSKDIRKQATRQYELDCIKRRQVRVIRAIRLFNKIFLRSFCEAWSFRVLSKRRKIRLSLASKARNDSFSRRSRCHAFEAWYGHWRNSKSLEIHQKLAVSVMSNHETSHARLSLLNVVESFSFEFKKDRLAIEKVQRAESQLKRSLHRSSLNVPFRLWLSEMCFWQSSRQFLLQVLGIRPRRCRSYFRARWIDENRFYKKLSPSHCHRAEQGRQAGRNKAFIEPQHSSRVVSCMAIFNQSIALQNYFDVWVSFIHIRRRRRLLLAKAVRARSRGSLTHHLGEWMGKMWDSDIITSHLKMDALSQELVDLAQAKIASESRCATTAQRLNELQEISSQQTAAILSLERLAQGAQTRLRELLSGYEAADGVRTVTRVLRVLSLWKRSRVRQAWSTWVCVAGASRNYRNVATRLHRKAAISLIRRVFVSWHGGLMEGTALAEAQWLASLQQQLVALAGLQATTEAQLRDTVQENAGLKEKISCCLQDLEDSGRSIAVMHIVCGSRFCRTRRIQRAWRLWLQHRTLSASRQRAVMRCLLNKLRYYLSASSIFILARIFSNRAQFADSIRPDVKVSFSWQAQSENTAVKVSLNLMKTIAFSMLRNKICLYTFWSAWLQHRFVRSKFSKLRKRCNHSRCARTLSIWKDKIEGRQGCVQLVLMRFIFSESFSMSTLVFTQNLSGSHNTASPLQRDMFPKSTSALYASKNVIKAVDKSNYWFLIHSLTKCRCCFHHIQKKELFSSWKKHLRRRKRIFLRIQEITANTHHRILASTLQLWIESYCKTLSESEERKLETIVIQLGMERDRGPKDALSLLQNIRENAGTMQNVGLIKILRIVKICASLFKLAVQATEDKRLLQETQLMASQRNVDQRMQADLNLKYASLERAFGEERLALESELQKVSALNQDLKNRKANVEIELAKLRILEVEFRYNCAASRILRVVRFLRSNLMRRYYMEIVKWRKARRYRHRILAKVTSQQRLFLTSNLVAEWFWLTLNTKVDNKNLKIGLLEENCASLLRMKEDAETRVSSMIELKKEIERTWSKKYNSAVLSLERKFADLKQQLDAFVSDTREKYLQSATMRVFRVVTHFQFKLCHHSWRTWRHCYLRRRFLQKTVVVFVKCMLGRAFDWWTLQAEYLKSLALESSACSLEKQLISVNERLRRRLQVSETQVRYVLGEQEQIQLVLDKRHIAMRTSLELQLAQANQMRDNIAKMYQDIKQSVSALRIMHVIKYWNRLLQNQIYVLWQLWVRGKKKRRTLAVRSIQGRAFRVIVRYLYFWVVHHYNVHLENLNNTIVETQLSAAKEMHAKEQDIAFMMEQINSAIVSGGELSSRLKTTAGTVRQAVTSDLAWVMRDLSRWKAEAEAQKLEAKQQEQYKITSPL